MSSNKFTLKKVLIIITILFLMIGIVSFSVTYLVNSGKTKAESNTEDNYYNKLDELEKLEGNNNTSFNSKIDKLISLVFPTCNAATRDNLHNSENDSKKDNNNSKTTQEKKTIKKTKPKIENNGKGKEIIFEDDILKILEKYYILSKLNLDTMPKEVFLYGRKHWDEFPKILNSYDYLNHTNTLGDFIKLKKQFKSKRFYENTIKEEIITIINDYFKNKKKKTNITFLPKDINNEEGYQFMINGLKNHDYLINVSKKIAKELDYDYKLTLAAILTEQFRYNGTYRGYIKKYLKGTPFLFSMTQWSYGIGGIKEFTGNKILEDAKKYGYYDKVFKLKDSDDYKNKTTKQLLQDPYWETVFPNVMIKNIIKRWELGGHPIDDKPGIILTLYNFGNHINKNPHKDPKIGGAIIKLNERADRQYTFGGLGEALYWYIKVYNLY